MSLKHSEWILATSFSLFLVTLILISRLHLGNQYRRLERLSREHAAIPKQFWTVTVEGAVTTPGSHRVLHGTPLSAVLKQVRPLRSANLRGIDPTSPITQDLTLQLEELTSLQIHIEGAVQHPITLELPVGSRLCHLKPKIEGIPETDWSFFRRKRLLRDGETVVIPQACQLPSCS